MSDIEQWVESHLGGLERIAGEVEVAPELVVTIAVLVLAGLDDSDIVAQLRTGLMSMDGRHDPLEGAPTAIARVRELVATG